MTERSNTSKAIHLIGAILRGGREGDALVRRRLQGWMAFLTGGGFAVYAAVRLLTLAEDQIRQGWTSSDRERASIIAALRETTSAIKDQTQKIDKLADAMNTASQASIAEHAVLLDRAKGNRR